MRYVFVALLSAAMPGLAFAQPLTFEDALSRAETAPSVSRRADRPPSPPAGFPTPDLASVSTISPSRVHPPSPMPATA